jgi:hypothetical protein
VLILFYRRQFRELGYSGNPPQDVLIVFVEVGGLRVYYGLDLSSTS